MANEIERRYGAEGLHGLSIHPGGIVTAGYANMDPMVQPIFEPLFSTQKVSKSLSQGAATQVLAAVGKDYEGEFPYAYDLVRSSPLIGCRQGRLVHGGLWCQPSDSR